MKISQKLEVVPSILPQRVETSEPTLKLARDIQVTSASSTPSQRELLFGYLYQYPSYLWLWWLRRLRRMLYRRLALLLHRNGGKGLTPKGSPRDLKDSRHRWPQFSCSRCNTLSIARLVYSFPEQIMRRCDTDLNSDRCLKCHYYRVADNAARSEI